MGPLSTPKPLGSTALAEAWLRARGLDRRVKRMGAPGRAARAIRDGALTCEGCSRGVVTWATWLKENVGA